MEMMKRCQFFTIMTLLVLITLPALAQESVSVSALLQDPDQYDGKVVSVAGAIANYRERISARGNPYTTFTLVSSGSVSVFVWKHQGLHNSERVKVTGKFVKVKHVGQYTFHNEIEATQIQVLQSHKLGPPFYASIAGPHWQEPAQLSPLQSNCDDDSVDAVSEDGTILKTLSGHVFDIFDGSVDAALWLPADDLLICPTSRTGLYRLINTDENNEVAYGRRLR
jgi:hypothetical protein